jgi:hypothetical protein
MLMKYVKVNENGEISGLENKQALKYGYGSMLNLRVKLTFTFSLAYIYMVSVDQYKVF